MYIWRERHNLKWVPAVSFLATLLSAILLLTVTPARSATVASGSRYAVSFNGTGSESLTWNETEDGIEVPDYGGSLHGTWQIQDPEAKLWLPSAAKAAGEGVVDGFDLPQVMGSTDQAAITDVGTAYGNDWNCLHKQVKDSGSAVVTAGLTLGTLQVNTWYGGASSLGWPAFMPRWVRVPDHLDCDGSEAPLISYPLGNNSTGYVSNYNPAVNGSVGYGVQIPAAEVGKVSFTLPAEDQSTIDQASWWTTVSETYGIDYPSHSFGISGSYTFRKLCDGSITYAAGSLSGRCGGAGKPNTKIARSRIAPGRYRATFQVKATGGDRPYRFKCRLSGQSRKLGKWQGCPASVTYRHLKPGRHVFSVKAVDSGGVADPSPAKRVFQIRRSRHHERG